MKKQGNLREQLDAQAAELREWAKAHPEVKTDAAGLVAVLPNAKRRLLGTTASSVDDRESRKKEANVSDKRVPTKKPGITICHGSLYATLTVHKNTRSIYRRIGKVGAYTLDEAAHMRAGWLIEVEKGVYGREIRVDPVSFAEIADNALEYYKTHAYTWGNQETHIRLFKKWFERRAANSIVKDEIDQRFKDTMREEKWSTQTVGHYQQTLTTTFRRAVAAGHLTKEPGMDHYKIKRQKRRAWTPAEEELFRQTMWKYWPKTARYRLAQFDLALNTGMRKGNMYGIHEGEHQRAITDRDVHGSTLGWAQVKMDEQRIDLLWAKKGDGYFVPLNAVAMDALRILRERSTTGA
jgi:hypothetical protein